MLWAAPPLHTLSLDSRYFSRGNSNQAVGNFGLEFFKIQHFAFEGLVRNSESPFGRGMGLLGYYLYSLVFTPARVWMFAYHEYGHGGRFLALGATPLYLAGNQADSFRTDPTVGYRTFLPFFVYSLSRQIDYGATAAATGALSAADDAIISMAGINNSSYFAELIEDQILSDGGSFLFYFPWITSMRDAHEYSLISESNGPSSGDDMAAILSYYSGLGYDIGHSTVRTGAVVSILLNPMLYYFIYSGARYVRSGDHEMLAPRVGNLWLPRLHQYFTSHGLSMKVITGWEISPDLQLGLGVERVYLGDTQTEFSASVRYRVNQEWQIDTRVYVGQSPCAGLSGTYFTNGWRVMAGLDVFHPNSLFGERNTFNLSAKEYSGQVWSRVSIIY